MDDKNIESSTRRNSSTHSINSPAAYQALGARSAPTPQTTPRTSMDDEIIREKQLKNDDTQQDIKLKRNTLNLLFCFLGVETITIFVFAFLQATDRYHFHLEEWSFKLLVSATIAQITIMLSVAVNYLFPKKHD